MHGIASPTWVATPAALEDLIATLSGLEVWGFDTEFHRERTYYPHLALVQIAWPDGIALVDPLAVDVAPLGALLDDPGTVVVAHAAEQDLEVLDRSCGTGPAHLFDTQIAAGFCGFASPSLSTLVERMVGVHLAKGDRLTDWARRPLSESQLLYAAADVEHLLSLHRRLVDDLTASGRLAWAEAECLTLLRRRRSMLPEQAWWRMKESRSLRGVARGVAQEVAAWRERRAAQLDVPVRFVLPDLALLGIAHSPPSSAADLARVRGLDARSVKGPIGESLLEAVARGRMLVHEDFHLPPQDEVDKDLRPAVSLAAAWVAQLGRDIGIDPALLATRNDLQSILRGDGKGRATVGWRAQIVGEPVRRLASGDAALAFDGKGGLILEERSRRPWIPPADV